MKSKVRLFWALLTATLLLAGSSAWAQKGGKNGGPKGKACCEKFVDANKDGVCDNFVDADGDGKCDLNCCGSDKGAGKNCKFVDKDGDGKCDLNCCGSGKGAGKNCKFVDKDGDGKCDSNCKGIGKMGRQMRMDRCPEFVDANNDGKCDICAAKIDSLKTAGWTKEDFKRECGKKCFPRFNDSLMRLRHEGMIKLIDSLKNAGWDLGDLRKDFEALKNGRLNDSLMREHRERMKALMDSLRALGVDLRGRFMPPPPPDGERPDPDKRMGMGPRRPRPCPCMCLHHIGENAPGDQAPAKFNFELGNPYPVPAGENLNITLKSEAAGTAIIELYDANGKLVRSILDGEIKKGENKFNADTRGLQAGSYILKATVDGMTSSKNVIINK